MRCPYCRANITVREILEGDAEYNLFNFDGHSATMEIGGYCPKCEEDISVSIDVQSIVLGKATIR
jgi:hypothetical protein